MPKKKSFDKEFEIFCKKNNYKVKKDEDGIPVLLPSGKRNRKRFKINPRSPGKVDLTITAESPEIKIEVIKKIKKTKVPFEIFFDGKDEFGKDDNEAILIFNLNDFPSITHIVNIKQKRSATKAELDRLEIARQKRFGKSP